MKASRRVASVAGFAAELARIDLAGHAPTTMGRIYPSLRRIRDVSAQLAVAVAEVAFDDGLARVPRADDVHALGARVSLFERGAAGELHAGVTLSILQIAYRIVDFDLGRPLHGPEVGVAVTF